MTTKDDALKLALEALEESLGYVEEEAENALRMYDQYPTRQARIQGLKDDARKHMNAITAVREALAERQESTCKQSLQVEQPAQQQAPVAWKDRTYGNLHHQDFGNSIPLYTSPPASKPWVGLTEDEIDDVWGGSTIPILRQEYVNLAQAIEAKLREKNAS